jgi:hypothetical protein
MVRGPCTFKHRDVVRALKATRAAGEKVARVEITKDGTIIMITGKPASQDDPAPLDRWLAENADQT